MSTYTQILYQIVFSTKQREQVLEKENRPKLFKYIWGILNKSNCHLYRINGVDDHLHIVTHLHPSIALASLVKNIKIASSGFIKNHGLFKHFNGWQDGYAAFTYSIKEKDRLIDYVKNQEEHHKLISFRDEYIELLKEHEIEPARREVGLMKNIYCEISLNPRPNASLKDSFWWGVHPGGPVGFCQMRLYFLPVSDTGLFVFNPFGIH